MPRLEPERLLDDLDPEQREAVLATSGPVAILAGAGTGKTRVISRRTAYAIATERRAAGPGARRHVHRQGRGRDGRAAAGARPAGRDGADVPRARAQPAAPLLAVAPRRRSRCPQLLDSKLPILGRLARQLPGHYRFTPAKDLADEIEWAKSPADRRRATYEREVGRVEPGREPPIPVDLFVRTFDDYERAKARAGPDRLRRPPRRDRRACSRTTPRPPSTVRARKRWFSVDEYQDTSPLQQRLLELWLGDRADLCVVGDDDQTIYTFTGASSDYLTTFAERHPGAAGRST